MREWKQANSVGIGTLGAFAPKNVTRYIPGVSERHKM
jgi:hypothetical protein